LDFPLGLATEFRSKTSPWNRLKTVSIIPRKKVLIPRSAEELIPKLRTKWNGNTQKKFVLRYSQNNLTKLFVRTSKVVKCFGTEFRKFASIFVPRNEVPSCFLFHGMVRNGILRICFYFCYMERNSEHFSLPRNDSKWNSESLLKFFFPP
jgi:hypothetical protein